MAAPLEWVFKLTDKMSGPAKAISDALGKTETATKATTKATDTLQAAQSAATGAAKQLEAAQNKVAESTNKASGATLSFGGRLGAFGQGMGAFGKVAGGVALGIGAIGVAAGAAVGKMFEVAAAQDRMNRAFGASLGGGGPAVQAYIKRITGSTEFTRQQLEELALPLARQGMGDTQVARLLPAALDVQAQGGSAAQAIEIFSKIASTGKVEGEAFKALNLNADKALTKIGERVGLSSVADTKKAIEAGQIRSNDILEGLLTSIAGEGMLGDKAAQAAKSPSAALNRFAHIQETVIARLAESQAMPKLTAALEKFTNALTSDKVVEGVTDFFEKVAEALEKVNWTDVAAGVEKLINTLAKAAPYAETALNVASLGSIGDAKFERIRNEEGGWRGAVSYVPFLRMLLDTDKINGAPAANDFVMRADGSILNIDSQDDIVGFKPGGPILSALGGGSGVSVGDIHVHVDGGGGAEDMGARIAASIRQQLVAELDRMAVEVGA